MVTLNHVGTEQEVISHTEVENKLILANSDLGFHQHYLIVIVIAIITITCIPACPLGKQLSPLTDVLLARATSCSF